MCFLQLFSICIEFGFVIFWRKEISIEAARRIWVKLTTGVNFTRFYRQLFHTKRVLHSFYKLEFGFVIFCQKNIGKKASRKMLVKLNTGVNFTNIFQAAVSYKRVLRSFCLLPFWFSNISSKEYFRKNWSHKMLVTLTKGWRLLDAETDGWVRGKSSLDRLWFPSHWAHRWPGQVLRPWQDRTIQAQLLQILNPHLQR